MIPGAYASMAFTDPRYDDKHGKDKNEAEVFIEIVLNSLRLLNRIL